MWLPAVLAFGTILLTAGVGTAEPRFVLPLDCAYGRTCFIQNYVDRDPGPGHIDHACGRLTYDGDGGTDFRLRDYVEMERGYPVLAAAAGTVRATRDGMADVSIRDGGIEAVRGREAGNSVVLDHGGGWTTQYSHLKRGSVAVRTGETVTAGQILGLVGLSGRTEFPHVEFKVRFEGTEVDPFVGKDRAQPCGDPKSPMWMPEVAATLAYLPTGLLSAAFAAGRPEPEAARRGAFRLADTVRDPEALVFWVDLFGVQEGDVEAFTIRAPDGRTLLETRKPLTSSKVSWFAFAGARRPQTGWVPGRHLGVYELTRGGVVVVRSELPITVAR